MKIAIPCENGQISAHFGHAGQFVFFDADISQGTITSEAALDAPPHEPGLLPRWLAENGANVVLAMGMGGRAVQLLEQQGVKAVTGINAATPREAAEQYLKGVLTTGENVCHHDEGHACNDDA